MNCSNIKKYFYAFLDGELDVEKNIEILAHLDMCYECSQKMEVEKMFNDRIRVTVCKVKAPVYLRGAILKGAERSPAGLLAYLLKINFLLRRPLIMFGAIAMVVIVIASFFVIQDKIRKNDALYILESRYHAIAMKQLEPSIHSQNAEEIIDYIQGKANLRITLPDVKGDLKLVGAALSSIKGASVPSVFYTYNDTPVALFIICNPDMDFSRLNEAHRHNASVYTDTGYCGFCEIIAWKGGGNRYVIVSTLNREKMLGLLTKV